MLRSLVEGKKVKVDRIAKILRQWSTAPHAMSNELIDLIEQRFGTSTHSISQSAAENEAPAHA
jgi:hypothetical protein